MLDHTTSNITQRLICLLKYLIILPPSEHQTQKNGGYCHHILRVYHVVRLTNKLVHIVGNGDGVGSRQRTDVAGLHACSHVGSCVVSTTRNTRDERLRCAVYGGEAG